MIRISLLAGAVAMCCAAADFPVGGVVVDASDNIPLPRARVAFFAQGASTPTASLTAAENGRFELRLPEGSYRMYAGTRDTWETYGTLNSGSGLGSAVIVGPGKDASDLTFRYHAPAAIFGRVTDESGEPVENALVQLIRSGIVAGSRTTSVLGFQRTDDRGEYRFGQLPGGSEYYLAVTGEPWYVRTAGIAATAAIVATGSAPATTYAPVYYPNTSDASKASAIRLRPRQQVRIDLRLGTVLSASVTVFFNTPPGTSGVLALSYDGVAGMEAFQQSERLRTVFLPRMRTGQPVDAIPRSQQVLNGIPPGHYKVTLTGTRGTEGVIGTAEIDVNGADTSATLDVKTMAEITGKVTGAKAKGMSVGLVPASHGNEAFGVTVRDDGSFSFPRVPPGPFRVMMNGPGVYVEKLSADGASLKNGVIEVGEGQNIVLSLVAGNDTGRIKGTAMNGIRRAEGVWVLLVPMQSAPGDLTGSDPHLYQTESDGSFDYGPVRTGRYRILAIDNPELEFNRREVLAPLLVNAKEIEVRSGASLDERVVLTPKP